MTIVIRWRNMMTLHENVCLSFSKDLISFSCAFLFRRVFSRISSKTVIRYSDASMLKRSQALWQKLRLITSEDTARNIPFLPAHFSYSLHLFLVTMYISLWARVYLYRMSHNKCHPLFSYSYKEQCLIYIINKYFSSFFL